jgi:hypothetical protein
MMGYGIYIVGMLAGILSATIHNRIRRENFKEELDTFLLIIVWTTFWIVIWYVNPINGKYI